MELSDEKNIINKQQQTIKFLQYKIEAMELSRFWRFRNIYHRIFKRENRLEFDNPFVDYEESDGELPLGAEYFGTDEETALPSIDIIALNYNSKKYINVFLNGLVTINYPADKLRVFIIDNNSTDGSFYYFKYKIRNVKNCFVNKSIKNLGFTGGNNIGLRLSRADFKLLVNIDTEIKPDCLKIMIRRMVNDATIGLVEAKQVPHEQPKEYDIATGETSWCSGACVLIRGQALRETGLFDEKFFHYVEDVDLSWRMWSMGWKCVYEPKAECLHFNSDPFNPKKTRYSFLEFTYGIRNGIFMRLIYGSVWFYMLYLGKAVQIIFFSVRYTFRQRIVVLRILLTHWLYWPHLWLRRRLFKKSKCPKSPYIKFHGMGYAKLREE